MKTHDPWLLRLTNLSCLTSADIAKLLLLFSIYDIKKLAAVVITGVGVQGKIDEYLDSLITVRLLMTSFQMNPEQLMILPNKKDHQNLIIFSSSFHKPWSGRQFNPAMLVTLGLPCYELIGTPDSTLKMEAVSVSLNVSQPCKRIFVTQDPVENWQIELLDHEQEKRIHPLQPCSLQIMEYQPSTGPDGSQVRFSCL